MSYHPPSFPTKTNIPGKPLLRVLGALLSLVSMLLAALGIFFHQNILGLIFAGIVALFGLRVFVLWLGARQSSATVEPTFSMHPSMYPGSAFSQEQQSTGSTAGANSPAANSSLWLPPAQPAFAPASTSAPTQAYPSPFSGFNQEAAYPLQPQSSYALQSAYGQVQPPQYEEQQAQISASYIPIEKDAIFELDRPTGNVQCFILPKEGEPLIECQDSYALQAERHCYAIADGVAGSFVPGPWARIVAKGFVERGGNFANKDDFQAWLIECSQQWHTWIEKRWLPTMNTLRERNGDRPGNWSDDIRQGAQTTLIGCSLLSYAEQRDTSNAVSVFAIGDGEFFLFSPNTKDGWDLAETFPYSDPSEFGFRPDTLVTVQRMDLLKRAWLQRKTKHLNVFTGDIIVLASDTLAKWLLTQIQQQTDRWMPFLTGIPPTEFEQRIRQEFHQGRIEDDDLTMLVIPVQ